MNCCACHAEHGSEGARGRGARPLPGGRRGALRGQPRGGDTVFRSTTPTYTHIHVIYIIMNLYIYSADLRRTRLVKALTPYVRVVPLQEIRELMQRGSANRYDILFYVFSSVTISSSKTSDVSPTCLNAHTG